MAGRPTMADRWLQPENIKKIKDWASSGVPQTDIANNMGVAAATLINWKKRYPEIAEALIVAEEEKELVAIGSLYKLMCGYYDEEVTVERYRLNGKILEDDPNHPIKEIVKRKFVPPNMGAIAFYLKCRHGWREKQDLDVNVKALNPFEGMSTAELRRIANDVIDVD